MTGTTLGEWEWGPHGERLTCIWDEAWVGECGDPAVSDGPPRCEEHDGRTCIACDAPAVKGCHATGGLVCGAPLCEDHTINDCDHYFP